MNSMVLVAILSDTHISTWQGSICTRGYMRGIGEYQREIPWRTNILSEISVVLNLHIKNVYILDSDWKDNISGLSKYEASHICYGPHFLRFTFCIRFRPCFRISGCGIVSGCFGRNRTRFLKLVWSGLNIKVKNLRLTFFEITIFFIKIIIQYQNTNHIEFCVEKRSKRGILLVEN